MRRVRGDRFVSQPDEIPDVGGDNGPSVSGGPRKLRAIIQLKIADVEGADGVNARVSQYGDDGRREILVEVDFHLAGLNRTRPGYCRSIASGVSAAFASISRWTSSE